MRKKCAVIFFHITLVNMFQNDYELFVHTTGEAFRFVDNRLSEYAIEEAKWSIWNSYRSHQSILIP